MVINYTLITNKRVVNKPIPTSWPEVTFEKYVELINYDDGTIERRIAILSSIDYEMIKDLPANDMVALIPAVAFSFDYKEITDVVDPPEYKDWYIGHQSWAKLEKAKQAIAALDGKDSINAGAAIVLAYTEKDISQSPVTQVLGEVNFFLRKYIDFMSVLNN